MNVSSDTIERRLSPLLLPSTLLGVMAGYVLAHYHVFELRSLEIASMVAILTLAALSEIRLLRLGALFLSSTLLASAYYHFRYPELSAEATAVLSVPREVTLEIEISRTFGDPRQATVGGLAVIRRTPAYLNPLAGQLVGFRLYRYTEDAPVPVLPGSRIEMRGVLLPLGDAGLTPGFEGYLRSQQCAAWFHRSREIRPLGEPSLLQRTTAEIGAKLESWLRAGSEKGENYGRIYASAFLGRRDLLRTEDRIQFQQSGTMHIFAVSGMHVAILGLILSYAALILRLPRIPRVTFSLLGIALYVAIVGAPASAVRAFIMTAAFLMAPLLGRQRAAVPILVFTALLLLLADPTQIWSTGFQLSYAVVASILIYGIPLGRELRDLYARHFWLRPEPSRWERIARATFTGGVPAFAVSLAAWCASTPLIAGGYGLISFSGLLVNPLILLMATLLITAACLSVVTAALALTPVSLFLNRAGWMVAAGIDRLSEWGLKLPFAHLDDLEVKMATAVVCLSSFFALACASHLDPVRRLGPVRFVAPPLALLLLAVPW